MITPLYLVSKAERPRLRVGLLIDGPRVPRYAATILGDIARCNFAAVELAIVLHPAGPPPEARLPGLVHEIYARVDRARGGAEDPLALVDPGPSFAGVHRIEASPVTDTPAHPDGVTPAHPPVTPAHPP
jgi:hypothetical protein